jgi:hypothetical protein
MALLPLHQAIECVLKLFQTKMQGPWPRQATFSAGLAVVHALEPLTEARKIARRAERAAKSDSQGGRNALAIIVAPRSGAETLAFGRFDDFPDLLLRIIGYNEAKSLSLGFAHELRNLLERIHLKSTSLSLKWPAHRREKTGRQSRDRTLGLCLHPGRARQSLSRHAHCAPLLPRQKGGWPVTQQNVLIEPRDPAIFRDARPFETDLGARTLSWPTPSAGHRDHSHPPRRHNRLRSCGCRTSSPDPPYRSRQYSSSSASGRSSTSQQEGDRAN